MMMMTASIQSSIASVVVMRVILVSEMIGIEGIATGWPTFGSLSLSRFEKYKIRPEWKEGKKEA